MKKIIALVCAMLIVVSGCNSRVAVEHQGESTVVTRIASLKGPTSMGLVKLMSDAEQSGTYDCTIYTAADEIVSLLSKAEVDVALIPANLAAVLYQKTQGEIIAVDINASGVLYGVSTGDRLSSVLDLKTKTIYMTGKGTTPEWSLRYLLSKNDMDMQDLQVEFKAEPVEVVSALAQDPDAIGILPQPFATVAMMKNSKLHTVLSLDSEWSKYSKLERGTVTGVTVVRKEFLQDHEDAVIRLLADHEKSVKYMENQKQIGAELIEEYGIVDQSVAQKVLEEYNPLVSVSGQEMKDWLGDYLEQLFEISPEAVGGQLPGDDFYYVQ